MKRIKVVICDDEKMVCELLQRFIDWDSLGMDIIGVVYDGISALNLIEARKPDIVITDIRMPDMDGIELVKAARNAKSDTRFIVISGHKQFDYAYNAIKYGVEDYLLKPIKEKDLLKILNKISAKISMNIENNKLKNEYNDLQYTLRAQFMIKTLENSLEADLSENNIYRKYGLSVSKGFYQLIAVRQDYSEINRKPDFKLKNIIQDNISNIIYDALMKHCTELELINQDKLTLCFLNYSFLKKEIVQRSIKRLFPDIQAYIKNINNYIKATLIICNPEEDLRKLHKMSESIQLALKSRIITGVDRIIEAPNYLTDTLDFKTMISSENWQKFNQIIDILNINGMAKWMESVYTIIMNASKEHPNIFVDTAEYIINLFFILMERNEHIKPNSSDLQQKMLYKVSDISIAQQLWDSLKNDFLGYMEKYLNQRLETESKPIRLAKQYIQEHLNENITLESVASSIHYNSVYLCTLFKKVTGVNFIDYVTENRINKAKALLKDTQFNIGEVSLKVGYKDARYFSKKFKEMIGITPQMYRNIYS